MHELVYTSAPKGLKPGSQGFCTVACSAGMPPNLMMRLEALSAYRPLTVAGSGAVVNPVVLSHLVLRVGGADWHVLSRIADAGVDYTQRSNKIAHHVVLEPAELPPAGPAALLRCGERFFREWDGEPKVISKPAPFPRVESQPRICRQWQNETGDAGWGGVLAETMRDGQPVIVVAKPETDVIALFDESLALLPPDARWQTTLTTYYTRFPSGIDCRWRCIMAGSPEMSQVGRSPETMIVDLTQTLKTPVPRPLVKAARSGKSPVVLDTERQTETSTESQKPATPDDVAADANVDDKPETVPVRKGRGKRSKRKRQSQAAVSDGREQQRENANRNDKRGLLVLLALAIAFFVFPALLLAALLAARGCNDPTAGKKRNASGR